MILLQLWVKLWHSHVNKNPLQTFCCHLIVQNVSDQLPVASEAVCLGPVGLNEVILAQVQLWPTVHDVGNNSSQLKPLLRPCCVLVRLVVTVQELENRREPWTGPALEKWEIKPIQYIFGRHISVPVLCSPKTQSHMSTGRGALRHGPPLTRPRTGCLPPPCLSSF